ncbi:hypothetical protein KP509_12G067600 [Ceratopteris richardii]|uniref:Uncharacterized protein n=1 Tax=Ceratopteris richardii TaxID=49495 RepID=A0A8T2TT20_CERRI|nr:hypothetical protein KP509_12G067600 [Ceratopteris richardii]
MAGSTSRSNRHAQEDARLVCTRGIPETLPPVKKMTTSMYVGFCGGFCGTNLNFIWPQLPVEICHQGVLLCMWQEGARERLLFKGKSLRFKYEGAGIFVGLISHFRHAKLCTHFIQPSQDFSVALLCLTVKTLVAFMQSSCTLMRHANAHEKFMFSIAALKLHSDQDNTEFCQSVCRSFFLSTHHI